MQYVGAVVGGVIGFYAGGVTGAIYGAEIGYTIGGVIQASNSKIVTEGPRLSDLKTTFSSNGAFIPRIYVHVGGIGGNIIDGSQLIPAEHTTDTSSGKGGPTQESKTTTYSASFLVLLGVSFGDREVITIKANGNVIWSRAAGIDAASQLVETGLVKRITVYNGAQDQLPDPTLEAIHGVGNVPAYRGRLSVMFEEFQLANFSNNIEATMLTFEVVEGTKAGQMQTLCEGGIWPMLDKAGYWIFSPSNTGPSTLDNGLTRAFGDPYGKNSMGSTGNAQQVGLPGTFYLDALDGSGPVRQTPFRSSDNPITSLQVDQPAGYNGCPPATYQINKLQATGFNDTAISPVAMVWLRVTAYHIEKTPFTITGDYGQVLCAGETQTYVDDGDAAINFYTPVGLAQGSVALGRIAEFRNAYPAPNAAGAIAFAASNGTTALVYVETTNSANASHAAGSYVAWTTENGGAANFTLADRRVCGITVTAARIYLLTERFDAPSGNYEYDCQVYDALTGASIGTWTGPLANFRNQLISIFSVSDRLVVTGSDGAGAGYLWHWDDAGDLVVVATLSSATVSRFLAWDAPDEYVVTGTVASPDHSSLYQLTSVGGMIVTPNGPKPLREVITEIAAEKNVVLGPYCFTQLPDTVTCDGYVVTRQTSPRVAIDFLRDLYRVDCAEEGQLIKFVLRGGDAVRTLTMDDLGAREGDDGDPPQAIEWTIADELSQPAAVNLKFCDRENNFEIGTAIARRETTPSQTVVTLDASAVMLTGTQAARLAEQALTDQRLAAETVKFSTLYAHEDLETADPIIIPGKFKPRRVRIDGKTDKGGMIEWTATRDDPASLTQFVIGGGASNNGTGANVALLPVTAVDILNLPLLRNDDDEGGYYLFVYPTRISGFPGADVYDRTDYTPNKIGSVGAGQKPRGFTSTALGSNGKVGAFDLSAFVDVQFPAGTALESVTRDRIAAGQNVFLIGNEICGVCQTTALGGNVWRLHGGILRGMRGTEAAIGAHAAGERVYLLNAQTLLRDRTASFSGTADVAVSVGAVTQGRGLSDLKRYSSTGTNTSQALATFAPINLAYGEDGAGGLIFRWTRRTRLIFDFGAPAPLGEDTESYAIDFAPSGTFSSGVTFYSSAPMLRLSAEQRRTLPATWVWRVRQIPSGQGATPLVTPPRAVPLNGSMPADVLPVTVLDINPTSLADGAAITDGSSTPATITGQYVSVRGGRLVFDDGTYGNLSVLGTDGRFNFGAKDWSISIDLILQSHPTTGGGTALISRPSHGVAPGTLSGQVALYAGTGNTEAPSSGSIMIFESDFGAAAGQQVLQSQPGMNDGTRRTVRIARASGMFYLGVDEKLVDINGSALGAITDVNAAVPLTFGPIRGSIGRITVKTSA